jgi:hypothetical protein|tara:strand:+ start:5562 stop:5669 length:108 start_codon:yes stop_codon:yes gene_type:complete
MLAVKKNRYVGYELPEKGIFVFPLEPILLAWMVVT